MTFPADLMAIAEVCRIIPSNQAGKRLHVGTVHRWIANGLLRAWKRRGPVKTIRYVSRADVMALLQPEETNAQVKVTPRREQIEADRRREAQTRAGLKRFGLDRFLKT